MRVVSFSFLACVLVASGCTTTFDPPTVDYKSDQPRKIPLDVPPDLTQLQRDDRYIVPGADGKSSATASATMAKSATSQAAVNVVAPTATGVTLEREGNQRWLKVNQTPDQLWPVVHQFWIDNGFTYQLEDQRAGLLETDWAENRANLPQGFVRRTFGSLLDAVSDSGLRDRYRTRLTRTADGTEITITHRGIEEVLNRSKDASTWQPRPSDPELEAEFLQRLMVKLGADAAKARTDVVASTAGVTRAPTVLRATMVTVPDGRAIDLDDTPDRAWRRVGLALDRIGFTVENRDRSNGYYVVRYIDPERDAAEQGFFARIFNLKPDTVPQQVKVYVKPEGALQRVTVLPGDPSATGARRSPSTAETKQAIDRITTQLFDELK